MSEVDDRLLKLMDGVAATVGKDVLKLASKGFERRPCASFGLPSLDHLLNGGIPHGTMVELWGPPGSGKSTLSLHLLANQIKNNNIALILDAENKLDPVLARNLGVDLSVHPYAQTNEAEKAFQIIQAAASNMNPGDVILVDSIAALATKAMLDGEMTDKFYGGNAGVLSLGIKKILEVVSTHGVIVIFINQLRQKMGVVYGPNEDTPCGNAVKFHVNVRMEVRKGQLIKEGDNVLGQESKVKICKSGHCASFQSVDLNLYFGKGFCKYQSLADLAIRQNIVEKRGMWLVYNEQKYQGINKFLDALTTEEFYNEIMSKVTI